MCDRIDSPLGHTHTTWAGCRLYGRHLSLWWVAFLPKKSELPASLLALTCDGDGAQFWGKDGVYPPGSAPTVGQALSRFDLTQPISQKKLRFREAVAFTAVMEPGWGLKPGTKA